MRKNFLPEGAFSNNTIFKSFVVLFGIQCNSLTSRYSSCVFQIGIVFAMLRRMKNNLSILRSFCTRGITISFLIIGFAVYSSSGQKALRTIENKAFRPGEKLKFRIHYGFIDAGVATMEVKSEMTNVGGRPCYHIVGTGETVGAFDWFFKVRDRYESIVDSQSIIPWLFFRRVNEGGYIINQNVSFNHYTDSAKSEKKTISIPEYTQDLVSGFYYSRTFDATNVKPGDIYAIPGYLDDYTLPLDVKFIKRDVIKTKAGTIRCLAFRPMVQEGRVFKENEGMTVWVSDDDNHIPVRVQAELLIGSLKMDLVSYENLASPLNIVKEK